MLVWVENVENVIISESFDVEIDNFVLSELSRKFNVKRINGGLLLDYEIKQILKKDGLDLTKSIFVTNKYAEIEQAMNYPICVMLISKKAIPESKFGKLPDFIISDISELNEFLTGNPSYYLGELIFDSIRNLEDCRARAVISEIQVDDKKIKLFSGGRRYSHSDFRAFYDEYSTVLLKHKAPNYNGSIKRHNYYKAFSAIINAILKHFQSDEGFDSFVAVPCKPRDEFDKFEEMRNEIHKKTDLIDLSENIKCNANYPSQKLQANAIDRELNVKGAFSIVNKELILNKNIAIIDDIIASGSTLKEIAKLLLDCGVAKVTFITLAVNQYRSNHHFDHLKCDNCGKDIMMYANKNDGRRFVTCRDFTNCNSSYAIEEVKLRFAKQIQDELISIETEEESFTF